MTRHHTNSDNRSANRSEVPRKEGPQPVTHHREAAAVVTNPIDNQPHGGRAIAFKEFLRSGVGFEELDLTRSPETPREVDWTSDPPGDSPDMLRDQGKTGDFHGRVDTQGPRVDEDVVGEG